MVIRQWSCFLLPVFWKRALAQTYVSDDNVFMNVVKKEPKPPEHSRLRLVSSLWRLPFLAVKAEACISDSIPTEPGAL